MAGNKGMDDMYEVEKIVGDRIVNSTIQYNIKWKGYSDRNNSWEPENSLVGCQSLVEEYRDTCELSSSPQKKTSPRKQASNDEACTPKRQKKSLARKSTGGSVTSSPSNTYWLKSPGEYSPSRYNFRRSTITQRTGVPTYLTTETGGPSESPLGYGFERRNLHMTDDIGRSDKTENERESFSDRTSDQPGRQVEDGDKTPSWMQLGYAELSFCLLILVMICLAIWFFSTTKLT